MLRSYSREDPEPMVVMDHPRQNSEATEETRIKPIPRETLQSLDTAQERELSNIARELHDDICQRLALLSFRIEKTAKAWEKGQKEVGEQLEQIWQQCSALTGDVHALSHALHPSILDNLGLVSAVRSFCQDISNRRGVSVEFTSSKVPDSLPREMSLSLFRLVQESLHNAVKHSGDHYFRVHMKGEASGIRLEICDQGVGFDVAKVWGKPGLGLISMRERIQLLKGTIRIESKPNAGTQIFVWVPLPNNPKALSRAAN